MNVLIELHTSVEGLDENAKEDQLEELLTALAEVCMKMGLVSETSAPDSFVKTIILAKPTPFSELEAQAWMEAVAVDAAYLVIPTAEEGSMEVRNGKKDSV